MILPQPATLTVKETEIARLLFKGLTNKQIASELGVGEKTVKFHLTKIYRKQGVKSRAQLLVQQFGVLSSAS